MSLKQISVFLENKSGRLADVTKVLGDAGINLLGMTIADTADFGILRIIVTDIDKTMQVLTANHFTAKMTDVLAIEVDDRPNGLSLIMEIFCKNNINIEYLYFTVDRRSGKHLVILKAEDPNRALSVIKSNGLTTLSSLE